MNAIYGMLAAPSAVNMAGRAAKAAATPFELLLQAASQATESTVAENEPVAEADDASTLQNRVARQLQQLLESLGLAAGDRVTLRIDQGSGEIQVDDHPLANDVEAAIENDSQLKAEIKRLAELDSLFDSAPFMDQELRVEVAEGQGAAALQWR
jgi:hypothetical protein